MEVSGARVYKIFSEPGGKTFRHIEDLDSKAMVVTSLWLASGLRERMKDALRGS